MIPILSFPSFYAPNTLEKYYLPFVFGVNSEADSSSIVWFEGSIFLLLLVLVALDFAEPLPFSLICLLPFVSALFMSNFFFFLIENFKN